MKKSGFKIFLILIALSIIAASVAVYYLSDIQKTQINSYAFRFVLFAEFIFFTGIGLLQSAPEKFTGIYAKIGVPVTLFLYFVTTLGLSLLGTGLHVKTFILIQIIFLCIAVLLILLFVFAAQNIHKKQAAIKEQGRDLRMVESMLFSLSNNEKYKSFHQFIDPIYETIRYFDPTASTEIDDDITNRVFYLQEITEKSNVTVIEVLSICKELTALCEQRKLASSQIKRGGF